MIFGIMGIWKGKKWPKITKHFVCLTSYLRNHISYDCDLWYTCVKWWYLQHFFSFFQNFDFWVFMAGALGGGERGKMTSHYQFQSVLLYISVTVDHIIEILIMISPVVKKRSNILNIKIIFFFLAHFFF